MTQVTRHGLRISKTSFHYFPGIGKVYHEHGSELLKLVQDVLNGC